MYDFLKTRALSKSQTLISGLVSIRCYFLIYVKKKTLWSFMPFCIVGIFLCIFALRVSFDCFKNLIQDSFVQHLFLVFLRNLFILFLLFPSFLYFYNEDWEETTTMMATGRVLWEGWIHVFIPYTSVEHMSYVYVPGTTLGSEATENKTRTP